MKVPPSNDPVRRRSSSPQAKGCVVARAKLENLVHRIGLCRAKIYQPNADQSEARIRSAQVLPDGRQAKGLRYRTSTCEAGFPFGLAGEFGFGITDAAADRGGREGHQPVIIADH